MAKIKSTPIQYLVYLLSKRDHSEAELRKKLISKEFEIEEIENAISLVQEKNWQNDKRFCSHFIRHRSVQGYGPNRLKFDLKQKGIKDWLINQELENCEIDWLEQAEILFNKKRPTAWDTKAKQKMWRYMLGRGFNNNHFSHLLELDYDE